MLSTPKHTPRSLPTSLCASFHLCLFPLFTPLSSSPRSVLWRSAPTALFLFWKVSPFHAGHSSPTDQSSGWLVWCLSQSYDSHVLLRTAHLWLWGLMWNYLLFLLSCVSGEFILIFMLLHKLFLSLMTTNFLFLPFFPICLEWLTSPAYIHWSEGIHYGTDPQSVLRPFLIRRLMRMNHKQSSQFVASLTSMFPAFHKTTSNTLTRKWLLILH